MTFFIVFSSFLSIIYMYTGFRLIPSLLPKRFALLAWFILMGSLVVLIAHIYLRVTFLYPHLSHIFAWVGYSGLGIVSYLVILLLFRDLGIFLILCVSKIRQAFSRSPSPAYFNPRRRRFLFKSTGFAITAVSGTAAGIGYAAAIKPPQVVNVPITLKKNKGLAGLTIAQFTDLHVGPTIKYPYVKQVCDIIMDLKADIIVFTGDMADGAPLHLVHDVSPLMALTAPLGKYFITGNHEYYSGAHRWIQAAKTLGFDPLINEHRVIEFNNGLLTLAGVTDIRAGAFYKSHISNPRKAFANCPENSFKLLLAHQPTSVYDAAHLGVDLQLSGHTHGGQYFPFEFFIFLEHPFIKGMHQYMQTMLYVSQGTGYWGPPLRLGSFPEITLFTFR